jgi:hypothetical protein
LAIVGGPSGAVGGKNEPGERPTGGTGVAGFEGDIGMPGVAGACIGVGG